MCDQQEIGGHRVSCGYLSGAECGKRVDLLFLLRQEIHGRFVQYKQSGRTIERHFRGDRGGEIVCAEHSEDRNEVGGARGIAAEERSLLCMHEEIKRPTRQ